MTASPRRTVIVTLAALAVAVVLVWAASSGPTELVTGPLSPRHGSAGPVVIAPDRTAQEGETDSRDAEPWPDLDNADWVVDIASVAVLLGGLWLLSLLVRLVVARLPARQLVLDLDPLPRPDAGHEAVQHRENRLRESLVGTDLRNGIVACWVLLEEAAAEAGVSREPAETATELVVRFLHALDVDPRPVATLAALFHEARFSTHRLTEDHVRTARSALEKILREVVHPGVGTS